MRIFKVIFLRYSSLTFDVRLSSTFARDLGNVVGPTRATVTRMALF
jgi:hypothetical protein